MSARARAEPCRGAQGGSDASTNSTNSSGSRTAICLVIPKRYQIPSTRDGGARRNAALPLPVVGSGARSWQMSSAGRRGERSACGAGRPGLSRRFRSPHWRGVVAMPTGWRRGRDDAESRREERSAARARLKAVGVAARGFSVTRASNDSGTFDPTLSRAIVCATRPNPGEKLSGSAYLVASYGCEIPRPPAGRAGFRLSPAMLDNRSYVE